MRPLILPTAMILLSLAGCALEDTAPPEHASGTFAAPAAVGAGLPDLIVDADRLARSWVIYDETFPSTSCSVQESNMTPGGHRVLRFTVSTPNVGLADVFVGDPLAHMTANDGLFEYATCHAHL